MPSMGRPRKPTSLEVLDGGAAKKKGIRDAPVARPDFYRLGAQHWPEDWQRRLDQFLHLAELTGVPIRPLHFLMVRELISLQASVEALEKSTAGKTTIPGERGGLRRNPELLELRENRKTLLFLLQKFGCSPYDFERLRNTADPLSGMTTDQDELEQILR